MPEARILEMNCNDTQHNDIQHDDTQQNNKSMRQSASNVVFLNVMLSAIVLNVAKLECQFLHSSHNTKLKGSSQASIIKDLLT
jgi:hypothetical protein